MTPPAASGIDRAVAVGAPVGDSRGGGVGGGRGGGGGGAVIDIVVPTVGRASLAPLLERLVADRLTTDRSGTDRLAADQPSRLGAIIVVDDRRRPEPPLPVPEGVTVVRSGGRGPAAARNAGWRASAGDWVAFLDDDVLPDPGWSAALRSDLAGAGGVAASAVAAAVGAGVAASAAEGGDGGSGLLLVVSQGQLRVPIPAGRRPTDNEGNVARLQGAPWTTADLAVPRALLALTGGFDERFPRAYREDTDLALRLTRAGVVRLEGERRAAHPPAPAPWWASVVRQRGNADDARMRRLHGREWRSEAGAARGRFRRHAVTVGCLGVAVGASLARRRRVARVAGAAWALATAELTWARCRSGPGDRREVLAMAATSPVLPFAAVGWRALGELAVRRGPLPWRSGRRRPGPARPTAAAAVLFDRDGTLVDDVPYNGDPARVRLRPGAREAVARARRHGLAVGLVTNQSGIGRGRLDHDAVAAVNAEVAALVGGLDVVVVCPHLPEDRCPCRKPAPGMVMAAAARLGVDPERCWVVGDIGADVAAAHSAGARAVLVPTPVTRPEEVRLAPIVAPDLPAALDLILDGTAGRDVVDCVAGTAGVDGTAAVDGTAGEDGTDCVAGTAGVDGVDGRDGAR